MQNNELQKYTLYFERAVNEIPFPSEPASLYQPMSYILSLGGKRIRPVLTLLAADVFCGDFQHAKHAALAVELFHNFSLIHDDIMDNAPLRRGQQTVHQKWNQNIAILSGDGMLIEAYKMLQTYSPEISYRLTSLFNKTASEVCEGQQFDMDFESSEEVSIDNYIEMIRLKTAVLLGCSLQLGAIVGEASEENQKDIYSFGVNLGLAFQLQDDILDLYGDQIKFGKQTGGDIIANKKTYLLLKAQTDANAQQQEIISEMMAESDQTKKIEKAFAVFEQLDIRKKAEQKMNGFYNVALENIDHLKIDSSQKKKFIDLADFLMKREH